MTPKQRLAELASEVIKCRACPRLVQYRELIARVKKSQFSSWNYWGRPVPGFGDADAKMMIVGLAPAPHGGNRTGRVFTGDRSADFLMKALFKAEYANQPHSVNQSDGLALEGAYMTAAVKCAPPENKPTSAEMRNCARFLRSEITLLQHARVILCLGQFAYRSTMMLLKRENLFLGVIPRFKHGLQVDLRDNRKVFASYHPSPRNTQTGTLTSGMFLRLLARISRELSQNPSHDPYPIS